MGVIGRESQYGKVTELGDDVSEIIRNVGLGFLPEFLISAQNKVRTTLGKEKITQSLGLAQFTPETWKTYGLDKSIGDFNSSLSSISQGLDWQPIIN
jgi:membrane-bound lytic murein transglycosylase B